jgi:hypothetical protein
VGARETARVGNGEMLHDVEEAHALAFRQVCGRTGDREGCGGCNATTQPDRCALITRRVALRAALAPCARADGHAQHAHTARKEATVYSGLQTVGMSTGRQKMDPLNEAQRPNVRGVRVVLSTGYNP